MLINSILNSSKATAPTLGNSTALISQIGLKGKPAGEFLSYEELQKSTRRNHRRFTTAAVTFLILSNLLSLWLLLAGRKVYSPQPAQCKLVFFSNFYVVFVFNFALVAVLMRNLTAFLKNKAVLALAFLSRLRTILVTLAVQLSFALLMFLAEAGCCSETMNALSAGFFGYQVVQFLANFGLGVFYHFRVQTDLEFSAAFDDEASKKPKEEKFNGSFALNLSKNGKSSSRELFRYKRKAKARTADKKDAIELQINVADFDKLEMVRKSEGEAAVLPPVCAAAETPTKRLNDQFCAIQVDA